MRIFVIDWHAIDVQNDVSQIEAMDHEVCGTAHHDRDQAVEAIRRTDPDVVVAWANRRPEMTVNVLRRVLEVGEEPAPLPTVFVDAGEQDRDALRSCAAPALFSDVGDLEDTLTEMKRDIKKAHKALEHAREKGNVEGPLAEEA